MVNRCSTTGGFQTWACQAAPNEICPTRANSGLRLHRTRARTPRAMLPSPCLRQQQVQAGHTGRMSTRAFTTSHWTKHMQLVHALFRWDSVPAASTGVHAKLRHATHLPEHTVQPALRRRLAPARQRARSLRRVLGLDLLEVRARRLVRGRVRTLEADALARLARGAQERVAAPMPVQLMVARDPAKCAACVMRAVRCLIAGNANMALHLTQGCAGVSSLLALTRMRAMTHQ
jgi:hypothetical protein